MSGSSSDVEPSQPPFERKRKRARREAEQYHTQSDGILIDIPLPSTAAMAELRAAAKPPANQLSPISLPSGIFDTQPTHTEDDSRLEPLPGISPDAFVPYLDDTTGMDLDATTSARSVRRPVSSLPREASSPVESFSPSFHTNAAATLEREEDVARIGNWILPILSDDVRTQPPDYSSELVLTQIPFVDELDNFDYLYSSQPRGPLVMPSQPSPTQLVATPVLPRESTPTDLPPQPLHPSSPPPTMPSAPIRSPSLPPPPRTESPEPTQPTHADSPLPPTVDTQSYSSFGWATLPKPEVIELMHQSPYIPDFLKVEMERYLLRSRRVSSPSQTTSQRVSRYRSPPPSQSQSQSLGASNDDSETQEDNFLRTKSIWYMDLLVVSSGTQPSNVSANALRLTQSQAASQNGMKDVGLILYTHEGTYSVQEVEENFAAVLRNDRRYSVWFDCHGRRWNTQVGGGSAAPALDSDPAARTFQLQDKVEQLQRECETANQQKAAALKELSQAREQHDFVRSLYDTASAAATAAQVEAAEATAHVVQLQSQLRHGLELHKDMTTQAVTRWKAQLKRVTAQNEFLVRQAALSDGADVRRRAALYDAYLQDERDKEQARQARIAAHESKRQKMLQDLGMAESSGLAQEDATGPFAAPTRVGGGGGRSPTPVGELDELAALAREAAEAGDLEADLVPSGRGKRQRRGAGSALSASNASNQPPPSPGQQTAQLEREAMASALALQASQQDVDDEFAAFMPRAPLGGGDASAEPPSQIGLDSMSMLPLTYDEPQPRVEEGLLEPNLAHDLDSAPSQHLDATQWGSLPSAPPPEPTQQSTGPEDFSGDTDTFQPYTQA